MYIHVAEPRIVRSFVPKPTRAPEGLGTRLPSSYSSGYEYVYLRVRLYVSCDKENRAGKKPSSIQSTASCTAPDFQFSALYSYLCNWTPNQTSTVASEVLLLEHEF